MPSEVVEALWLAALGDAGIDPADAVLFQFDGPTSSNGNDGASWSRYIKLDDPAEMPALAPASPRRTATTSAACEGLPSGPSGRRSGWPPSSGTSSSTPVDEDGRLYDLHGDCDLMLRKIAAGVAGSNSLYSQIPMEVDAIAAGARFARAHFGDAIADDLVAGGDRDAGALRPKQPLQPLDTLVARMKDFLTVTGPQLAADYVDAHGTAG